MLTPDGKYRIDCSEIGLLGSGAHGVVRIAQHVDTLEYVAMKITPLSVVKSSCKEVTALTRLNNAHIVQLLGVQVDMHAEKVYMVMELCQGGELFDRIAECGGLAEDEAKRYFAQTLHALAHCHENRVYHRDLKPENILLDADDNAKVADFGLAAVYRHVAGDAGGYLQHTKVGSVMYAAPEVLTSTAAMGYDAACADMWSLGVILFSMLSGTLPFTCAAASKCKRYAAVLTHGIGVMCPEHLSPQVTQLLGRLLHPDPGQRITPQEALQSEWVCGGRPTWPREYLGRGRPTDTVVGARSWTITMRVPANHLQQRPAAAAGGGGGGSSSGGGGGAVAGVCSSCVCGSSCACATDVTSAAAAAAGGATGATSSSSSSEPPGAGSFAKRKRDEEGRAAESEGPAGAAASESSAIASAFDSGGRSCFGDRPAAAAAAVGGGGGSSSSGAPGAAASGGADAASLRELDAAAMPPPPPPSSLASIAADAAGAAAAVPMEASGGASGSASGGVLSGLPLRGCVSEYVQRYGWSSLPQGTELLLRDILQTLRSMGLRFQLEEHQDSDSLAAPPAPDGTEMRTHRLGLTILF